VISWQIWFAGCDGSGTKSYNISQVAKNNTTSLLYEHFDNNTVRNENSRLPKGVRVLETSNEMFKTIKLIIESTEEQHYGSYFIENNSGSSGMGQLKKMVDGVWQEWSLFGPCSKTCVSCLEEPGVVQRHRTCKRPQNGGEPCRGKSIDEKTCARRCPIDARWSGWPSEWGFCNGNCKRRGEPVPLKARSRMCIPEAYGGMNCSLLEDRAGKNKQLLYKEERACSELPNCPTPASLGSWGEWSSCVHTCFPDGQPMPQREKRRSCNEAIPSADESLNTDLVMCKDFDDVKKYKNCNIPPCPIDAKWSGWPSDWSSCSGNCKKRGEPVPRKSRARTCIPGANGGKSCSLLEDEARRNEELLYKDEEACSELPSCPEQ